MSELKLGLRFFFSEHRLLMSFICTKFDEELLKGLKAIKRT